MSSSLPPSRRKVVVVAAEYEIMLIYVALWEFERRHDALPTGQPGQAAELGEIAEALRVALGMHAKAVLSIDTAMIE